MEKNEALIKLVNLRWPPNREAWTTAIGEATAKELQEAGYTKGNPVTLTTKGNLALLRAGWLPSL